MTELPGIAAAGDPLREFHTMTIEENRRTLQLNLIRPLALSRAILPGMLRRRRGHHHDAGRWKMRS